MPTDPKVMCSVDDRGPSRRAVLFSGHAWHGTPLGLHHVARTLAKLGWQVLFVEPRFSPLHLLSGRRRGRRFGGAFRTSADGVRILSPFVLVPHANLPLLRSGMTLRLASSLSWPRLPHAIERSEFAQPDLVINGDPGAADWALSLGARVTAYRTGDDLRLFDTVTEPLRALERAKMADYDVVLATSDRLLARAEAAGARRVHILTNGVDIEFFSRPAPPPGDLAELRRPLIIYAGAVESWFDWESVVYAAQERRDYTFAIIGPVAAPPPLDLPANVTLLGRRPYDQMPAYMQAATVGIIPFAAPAHGEAIAAVNPLKLYEYVAAGLPVVTSITVETLKSDAVFPYRTRDEFVAALDRAIAYRQGHAVTAPAHIDWRKIITALLQELRLT